MSGYTPVSRSIFEGNLCGQYPDTAAWLFMLALADKNGNVDKNPTYIATVTGMPVEDLLGCIERFMKPDPASRSSAEEGAARLPALSAGALDAPEGTVRLRPTGCPARVARSIFLGALP